MKKIVAAHVAIKALGSGESVITDSCICGNPSSQAILNRVISIESQKGVTMIEYALIASLVSIAAVATVGLIGGQLDGMFQAVVAAFTP